MFIDKAINVALAALILFVGVRPGACRATPQRSRCITR
jgi:hypothetical protein